MPQLELMIIKKPLKSQYQEYKPGEVYLLNELISLKFQGKIVAAGLNKSVKFIKLDDMFRPIDLRQDERCRTLVIRSGGIGDLIALSTVCEQLPGKVVFLTQAQYLPVFNWYNNPVAAIDYTKPVFTNFTFAKKIELARILRYAKFDDAVEEGSNENWYHIFYKSIGMDIKPELCRPHLHGQAVSNNIDPFKLSVIVSHRASSNMRSMAFEPIYQALKPLLDFQNHVIYAYADTLTDDDKKFIESASDDCIKIINGVNVAEFLNDLYCADLTISVDSSAIHFREGLKKPAIGIYSSFTSESRTKYYRYTHSIDIKSNCSHQPCFLHQTKLNEVCSEAMEGSLVAPCLNVGNIVGQLATGFEAAFAKFELTKQLA